MDIGKNDFKKLNQPTKQTNKNKNLKGKGITESLILCGRFEELNLRKKS